MQLKQRWIVAFLLAAHCAVGSASVLDQFSFLEPGSIGAMADLSWDPALDDLRRAQTFTVGIGGTLDHILVQFNTSAGFPLNRAMQMHLLTTTSEGLPGSIFATSSERTVSTVEAAVGQVFLGSYDFSDLGLSFQSGDRLAFEIVYGGSVEFVSDVANAGGSDFALHPSLGLNDWTRTGIDLAFQTYVTPVPLPASFVLLLSGMGGLVRIARRRREFA